MGRVRYFRDLEAWQHAMALAVSVHKVAATFPTTYRFELAAQIRKAAISVPSNIAEGHAQHGDIVFLRHLRIALGSLGELDTQLELAFRLKLVSPEALETLQRELGQTGRLVHGLRRAVRMTTARTILVLVVAATTGLWL
jgi:four helix bundle protein